MPLRTFRDSVGRTWQVWAISPAQLERRQGSAGSPLAQERRTKPSLRVRVGPEWASGWLAFETAGDKRRLTPYPPDWAAWPESELERLCDAAIRVDARRRLLR